MGTLVYQGPALLKQANTTVAAGNAIDLTLGTPAAGQRIVVHSISYSYMGTAQTNNAVNLQTSGGGTTYWLAYACGSVTGLGTFVWTFPSGLPMGTAEASAFTAASMANCEQRVSVTYSFERASG